MTDTDTKIAEHEQNIKSLQHQIDDVRETQKTIAKMSNTLIELTCEIKRTNDSIQRHEKNLEDTVYIYDEYRTAVPYRRNLLSVVKKSEAAWLASAKAEEAAAAVHKPTLEEKVAELAEENAKLRAENDTIGAALEETITIVLGGVK